MRTEAAGLPRRAVSTTSTQLGKLRMPDVISLSPARQLNRRECPIECSLCPCCSLYTPRFAILQDFMILQAEESRPV